MKEYKKELIICIVALATTGWIIWFFNRSLQSEKEFKEIDLYSIVVPHPVCIFQINRPIQFKEFAGLKQVTKNPIPEIFTTLLSHQSKEQVSLITFHPEGVLFYTASSIKQRKEMLKNSIQTYFTSYTPQTYEKYGIEFIFYPDIENRFWGYFISEGLLVAGYNRKLLEAVAEQYRNKQNIIPEYIDSTRLTISKTSPANLLLNGELLEVSFYQKQDTISIPENYWIGCDLSGNEQNNSISTLFSYSFVPEHRIDTFAFCFTKEIEKFISPLKIEYQLQKEEDGYFYTGSTNPS
ncbi:MAG: hypothetical protein LIP01_07725 [Tannerellaceae bacterium]|nr:hypothetical protein [Tannerellaceae bacterium]